MNIEEIKARAEAVSAHEYNGVDDYLYAKDVKALTDEVERLTAENKLNSAYAECYKNMTDRYGKKFAELLDKAKALQAENATLKNALEIASKEVNTAFETLVSHGVLTMEHKASNAQENVDTWMQRARQAQQTHETHGVDK